MQPDPELVAYDDGESVHYTRQERLIAVMLALAYVGLWFLLNWLLGGLPVVRAIVGALIIWFGIVRSLFIAIFGGITYGGY
jgi:fatty acid desaturase